MDGRPLDWRALMAGYEATVDWPGCTFYAELVDAFPDANEAVKAAVPADRLLVHEIGEGWDPLVRFLGVERPELTALMRASDTNHRKP